MSYLEKNTAALRSIVPATAQRVAASTVPGFGPSIGSDGTSTFSRVVTGSDGSRKVEWLGNTSMPRASAAAIVSSLDPFSNGANGLGLSIGTGYEWATFAAKLGRAQMLYVYESDAALLRMALEICDLAELLARKKIVSLTGTPAQAAEDLATFLDTHHGFEPPAVLHPLVSLSPERRNELLAAGEKIVRRAVTERQALEQRLFQELSAALKPDQAARRIFFLTTSAYEGERPLHREEERGKEVAIQIASHDACSTALRLETLLAASKTGTPTILSDLFRHQLGLIPPAIPVETWVPPLAGPGYWDRLPAPTSMARGDRIVVHAGRHAERLTAHGISPTQILFKSLRPIAKPSHPASASALRSRVALIADLPRTDMDALKIELPTHQTIYKAARDIIEAEYLTVHPRMAADILRRALGRAGVDPKTEDPAIKDTMLRLVRDILIPAMPPMAMASALAREGIPLTLIGDWPGVTAHLPPQVAGDSARMRHVPFASLSTDDWQSVAVLAHLSPEGIVSPLVWNAIAARCAIAAPRHPADAFDGSLPTLLKPEAMFAHPASQHFVATVVSLSKDVARRDKLAGAAAQALT